MPLEWDLIKIAPGCALWQTTCKKYMTITGISPDGTQVYSFLARDRPHNGDQWMARTSNAGINYVSKPRSKSYCRKKWKEIISK